MGNNHSKIKFECYLTMEERKLVTNFQVVEHKVYRNTTARKSFANVVMLSSSSHEIDQSNSDIGES